MSDAEAGVYGCINGVDADILKRVNPLVKGPYHTLGYDAFGEPYVWVEKPVPAKLDHFEFISHFAEIAIPLFESGVIKTIVPTVNKFGPGLENVIKGTDELRNGRVSGTKLVYTV